MPNYFLLYQYSAGAKLFSPHTYTTLLGIWKDGGQRLAMEVLFIA
jgi:hypothetical protein